MKWGSNSKNAGERLTKFISKIFGVKGVSVLLVIATFALLAGASFKWGG